MCAIAHLHQDSDPKDIAEQVGKVLNQGFTPRYTALVPMRELIPISIDFAGEWRAG